MWYLYLLQRCIAGDELPLEEGLELGFIKGGQEPPIIEDSENLHIHFLENTLCSSGMFYFLEVLWFGEKTKI